MTDTQQRSWWSRAADLGRRLETFLLTLFLGGLMLLAAGQILLRNVFSMSVTWGDGLARLAVLWLALLGAIAAARESKHIRMELAARWLPKPLQRWVFLVTNLFGAAVAGLLAWFSFVFVRDSRIFGDTLLGDVPAWWLQSIMPIAFALVALRFAAQAVRQLEAD